MKKNKVLLIGWDAADWKIINPLLDSGMMPSLESLVNNGVMGNLATLEPPLSPMLWTSISTGKHADEHGILGFTEPSPEGKGVRPCMITSRKVKAIWNILTQCGYKTNVVGWWPSHPAEPINGISISNFYQKATVNYGDDWPLAPGTVHPESKSEIFKELRVHPGELTEAHILPFVPDAAKIDQEKDGRLNAIGKTTAECSSIHAAATYILENEEWDFTAVYFDSIDHYCHGFMKYHPPRMETVSEEKYELYKGVVEGGYIYHDMMLGALLQSVDENTYVILISDHGFHSDHLRLKGIPDEPAGPAWEHRAYGIFVMKGPGILKDERIYGATLLDIVPTILTLYGLPQGTDMPGKSLIQSFSNPPDVEFIDTWEEVEGECGMHPADVQRDPIAEQAAMDQLIELGYIEKPDENVEIQIKKTVDESRYYLSRVLMSRNKYKEAAEILEELAENNKNVTRYDFHLAKCYDAMGAVEKASEVVEKIIYYEENLRAGDELKEFEQQFKLAKEKAKEKNLQFDEEKFLKNKPDPDKYKAYPELFLLKGTLELAKKNYTEALENLSKAEQSDPGLPQLHMQIGSVYLAMNKFEDAERALEKSLEIDPENARTRFLFSSVMLRKKEYEKAAEYALDAVGLLYHFPQAHLNLGIALAKLGMYERAVEAFTVCLAMKPGFIRAHRYLSYIYEYQLKDHEKANQQIEILNKLYEMRREKKQD